MSIFDFIAQKDFRASLDADYAEVTSCLERGAWKSVLVLAGSMVETLLVDYLVSTPVSGRKAKDPLAITLSEAIAVCKSEKVLSERSADLCAVVKSYRNLIHPGRVVRMNEPRPNKDSATVAFTLVHMIADELGNARAEKVGMTAAQIVSKILKDKNSLSILPHLLGETSEAQRANMLMDLIPLAHETANDDEFVNSDADRLAKAFSITFGVSTDATKKSVADGFVAMLKESDSSHVETYTATFYSPSFFPFLDDAGRRFVLDYLFGRVARIHTDTSLSLLDGLEEYLTPDDAVRWTDPFVRLVISPSSKDLLKVRGQRVFSRSMMRTMGIFDAAVKARLKTWLMTPGVLEDEVKQRAIGDLLAATETPI